MGRGGKEERGRGRAGWGGKGAGPGARCVCVRKCRLCPGTKEQGTQKALKQGRISLVLSRYHSHTIKSTLPKRTARWLLAQSQGCATIAAVEFQNILTASQRSPYSLAGPRSTPDSIPRQNPGRGGALSAEMWAVGVQAQGQSGRGQLLLRSFQVPSLPPDTGLLGGASSEPIITVTVTAFTLALVTWLRVPPP